MSRRRWPQRIQDILDAVVEIQGFIEGMDYDSFRADPRTLKAVVANITIIGEAAGKVPPEVADAHPDIPWEAMRSMRNRLVHVYFGVDPWVVWDTIRNDLPPLIPALRPILADES